MQVIQGMNLQLDRIIREFDELKPMTTFNSEGKETVLISAEMVASARECLRYIIWEEAGSNSRVFDNGGLMRDCDEDGFLLEARKVKREVPGGAAVGRGMKLADFVNHPNAKTSKLNQAQVAALRL